MKRIIALIPARERSVRIKNKNLKKICKQPLIWWTLEAAKKSKYVDEIYVSSDSLKILDYSKKNNVETIKRPKNISSHLATKKEVIYHALDYLKKRTIFLIILSTYNQPHHLEQIIILTML
ncbi:hypothetical protein ABXT68_00670 [Candidatus Pelagibacter sp. Uisw_116]|uniref:cytidylyltransferase domain-containing protein n=1 Tax=Candidatus Pelagibacter sp. Uisw_116 TaxID=3230986 RepID=UPI0039E8F196